MKKILLSIALISSFLVVTGQNYYFPPPGNNEWETITPTELGWCEDSIPGMLSYLANHHTKAFILLKDGKIVFEDYFNNFTADSAWYWASAGKTLTAITVGIAQQEGYLSIDQKTSDFLGEGWTDCPPGKEDLITIRHQLTMTTGLDDGVEDNFCTLDTCLQYIADAGTRWAYHNAPYTLLRDVLEEATGQNENIYVGLKILSPTGMTGTFLPVGYNNIFFSKARSMARFGLLMLNQGNWDGTPVLDDPGYFSQMVNTSQDLNLSYGYLWWLNGKESFMLPGSQIVYPGPLNPGAPDDLILAAGKNGQFINVVPSLGIVFIRMGNDPEAGPLPLFFNDTIWQYLNEIICTPNATGHQAVDPKLNIYPNPAKTVLHFDSPEHFSYRISDLFGKNYIEETEAHQGQPVNISGLKPGIYFVEIHLANSRIIYRKFVVNR